MTQTARHRNLSKKRVSLPTTLAAEGDPEYLLPQKPAEGGPVVGERGRLEITLWWDTTDDLDIVVKCPGGVLDSAYLFASKRLGVIAGRGPGVCGDGIIDVDANRKRLHPVNNPAEHAFWKRNVPAGLLEVEVVGYNDTSPNSRIPYSVRVEFAGEQKVCSGHVEIYGAHGVLGAVAKRNESPIRFIAQRPLPECQYEARPGYWRSGPPIK